MTFKLVGVFKCMVKTVKIVNQLIRELKVVSLSAHCEGGGAEL